MSPFAVASITAACIFGGALLGFALRRVVPVAHLDQDARDAIKLSAGTISLLAALVLGLLVSSAKNNFDATSDAMTRGGATVILLDRALARYGPESQPIRAELRGLVAAMIEIVWPEHHPRGSALDLLERGRPPMERVLEEIAALEPRTDAQRASQAEAERFAKDLLLSRWLQLEQAQAPLPAAFLRILVLWLTLLYVSFGLLAPRNATVLAVMFLGALSLGTALFVVLEMNDPMNGFIKISSGPMLKALEHLGQ